MKKHISFIITILLFSSCGMELKKTNKLDSLLDIGFEEKAVDDVKEDVTTTPAMFKSNTNTNYGVDISHFQGGVLKTIDIKAKNIRFVICKATQGEYFVDPDFRNNWYEIKEKGLIRGTYHFYDCNVSPVIQANHFSTTVGHVDANDIAPILDIEQGSMSKNVSGEQMVKDILIFLKAVEKELNRKPILYTDYAFAQEYFKKISELATYDLWLAEYSGDRKPKVPDIWKEKGYKIWQKSASHHNGSTETDFDEFIGPLNDIVK